MCTTELAACWFHRPWVRLKLPRNQSRDQYFHRLLRVTRGAHTLGTSMLCLWGCGSRGCISLHLVIQCCISCGLTSCCLIWIDGCFSWRLLLLYSVANCAIFCCWKKLHSEFRVLVFHWKTLLLLCKNTAKNYRCQTVDEYFGRQFAVRLYTNRWPIYCNKKEKKIQWNSRK